MINLEVRKLFFHFLKEEEVDVKYMRLFKKETEKPIENRYAKRVEKKLIDFCEAHEYKYWIIDAFTWDNNELWSRIHDKWINYYETNKHNLNNGVDTNG